MLISKSKIIYLVYFKLHFDYAITLNEINVRTAHNVYIYRQLLYFIYFSLLFTYISFLFLSVHRRRVCFKIRY